MAPSPSRWLRATMNGNWADRTLRVMVAPGPISFAERRSILQVLQQKGAIEVFKMVPDYPSQFIAVARTKETADGLLASSPLSYSVASPRTRPDISFIDLSRPDLLDGTKATIQPADTAQGADDPSQLVQKYRLEIFAIETYNHAGTMDSSPLHGPWPFYFTFYETFMSSILKSSLPRNMGASGLARWDYNLEGTSDHSRKNERLQQAKWLPSKMKKQVEEKGTG